jgi:hypothetical protein
MVDPSHLQTTSKKALSYMSRTCDVVIRLFGIGKQTACAASINAASAGAHRSAVVPFTRVKLLKFRAVHAHRENASWPNLL